MKPARLIVIGVAAVAGLGAAYVMSQLNRQPASVVQQVVQNIRTTEVLVLAKEIQLGATVTPADLRWQEWPQAATSPGMILRADVPGALEDIAGSIARAPSLAGEPVRRDRFIKGAGAGYLSAVLPSGKRAVAIVIDNRGAATAGNFILPNDRVDVVRTSRDDEAVKLGLPDAFVSQTILQNIRVLAIGQRLEERGGEKFVVGETATLELDPRQVEIVAQSQRSGQLTLSLRSMVDAAKAPEPTGDSNALTIVRFGQSQNIQQKK